MVGWPAKLRREREARARAATEEWHREWFDRLVGGRCCLPVRGGVTSPYCLPATVRDDGIHFVARARALERF